jgi:copper chaperone
MKTLKFKTNIKCTGCVAGVTPNLDQVAGQGNWTVDLQSPERILTVQTEAADAEAIEEAVVRAGFRAEPVEVQ